MFIQHDPINLKALISYNLENKLELLIMINKHESTSLFKKMNTTILKITEMGKLLL